MRNLRACLLGLLVVTATACGDDGGASPDAQIVIPDAAPDAPVVQPDAPTVNYDFSCMGNSAPTTATPTVTLSGIVQEAILMGTSPSVRNAQGVTIEVCRNNCQGPDRLDMVGPTGADGTFTTAALATNDVPLEGYLSATKAGNWPSLVFPASPIAADTAGIPVLMLSEQLVAALAIAGITQTPGNGIVGTLVTDCANMPIEGAVLSVKQNGMEVGNTIDASTLDPMGAGAFITFDVPVGDTEVSATYNNMPLRAHVIRVVANTNSTTQVRPGF